MDGAMHVSTSLTEHSHKFSREVRGKRQSTPKDRTGLSEPESGSHRHFNKAVLRSHFRFFKGISLLPERRLHVA